MVRVTLAGECYVKLTNSPIGPGSFERSHCHLGRWAEAHSRVDDDVVEVSVAVEVHGQQMGMLMSNERLSFCVPAGQFGTVNTLATACLSHESAVEQLGLRQGASARRERRLTAARRRQRE